MKTKITTKNLVFAGLLIAIEIILNGVPPFFISIPPASRISFGFIPLALAGALFGPIGGGLIAGIADFLRGTLLPQGTFSFIFMGIAILRGIIYGLFLHKKTDWKQTLLASTVIFLVVNAGVFPLVMVFISGGTYWSQLMGRIAVDVINYILQLLVLIPLLPKLQRRLGRHV